MDTIVSLITYIVVVLLCYGVAYLINVDILYVVSFVALAIAVDTQVRVD